MEKVLEGRVALVTGASRGIGRAIALALARAGADVAVNYLASEAKARDVCALITALGRRAAAVRADVSVSSEVSRLVSEVETELGPVSVLVNNAGIARAQGLEETTEKDWDELLAANLKSVFLVTQAVLPGMRARKWGRVVNISSAAAQTGGIVGVHYTAAKAGVIGLTRAYAARVAKEGVTVNAIAPAIIRTDMAAALPARARDMIPVGRVGTAEEVAEAALLLAHNGYITGQTLNLNGGLYMS